MKTFSRGALVYIPTGVRLYKLSDGNAVVRYKTISRPTNVLFMEKRDREYCTVLYEGEDWHVPSGDVYHTYIKKEVDNEH